MTSFINGLSSSKVELNVTGQELNTTRVEHDIVKKFCGLPPGAPEAAIERLSELPQKKQLIRLNWDKEKGNELFRQAKYDAAISKYKDALHHVITFDLPIRGAVCERYKSLEWVGRTT